MGGKRESLVLVPLSYVTRAYRSRTRRRRRIDWHVEIGSTQPPYLVSLSNHCVPWIQGYSHRRRARHCHDRIAIAPSQDSERKRPRTPIRSGACGEMQVGQGRLDKRYVGSRLPIAAPPSGEAIERHIQIGRVTMDSESSQPSCISECLRRD